MQQKLTTRSVDKKRSFVDCGEATPLPATRYPLPATRCPLPVARCPLPVARFGRLHSFQQPMQHLAHVNYSNKQGSEVLFGHHFKIARQLNVALEFRYRSKGVLEKARKLARTCMCAPFDDVRRHRHRSSRELVAKRCARCSAHAGSDSMRIDGKLPRELPYAEFSEVSHAESFIRGGPALPSFICTGTPGAASRPSRAE